MNPQPIKGKLPLLIALLILALSSMWLLGRCSRSNENSIANNFVRPGEDTLVVAIEFSPTSYSLKGSDAEGFDYEMIRDIAAAHGIPVVFHPFVPLDYALEGLQDGKFDMVVATVPSSSDMQQKYLLTDDVFIDRQGLVSRRADSLSADSAYIPPQMKLLGDTVWITASSPFRDRLVNLSQELGDTIYILSDPEYSAEHLALLTATGEIKQAVVNEAVARKIASDYPGLDVSTPISLSQFQPWILRSDESALRDSLNIWINRYKETDAYQRLVQKYLDPSTR
ncbi:MAG: transporter substrate-binding domain-containing protein [Muribaculaceae bacterium]|nr:transporter substrate-binding domain-containing protein [Muribaculaceae bacterium]